MSTGPGSARVTIVALLVAAACGRGEDPRPRAEPAAQAVAAEEAGALQQRASDADRLAAETRQHINAMWQLPPGEVPAHLGEHARRVTELAEFIRDYVDAAPSGGADDIGRGEFLGIRDDQLRLLRDEMQTAQAEAAELQNAAEAEIRARLRGHLDRLARVTDVLEASAAHLHRVAEQAAG